MVIEFQLLDIAPYPKGNMDPIQRVTYFDHHVDRDFQPKMSCDLD
jgi:hypothetical protein